MASEHSKTLPIFWGHGTADAVISLERAKSSLESLETLFGIKAVTPEEKSQGGVEFHTYAGVAHSLVEEEMEDWKAFLRGVIPA